MLPYGNVALYSPVPRACACVQDYVYVAYFLICTSTFLKIRWWVGTLVLLAPMVLADLWHRDSERKVGEELWERGM